MLAQHSEETPPRRTQPELGQGREGKAGPSATAAPSDRPWEPRLLAAGRLSCIGSFPFSEPENSHLIEIRLEMTSAAALGGFNQGKRCGIY